MSAEYQIFEDPIVIIFVYDHSKAQFNDKTKSNRTTTNYKTTTRRCPSIHRNHILGRRKSLILGINENTAQPWRDIEPLNLYRTNRIRNIVR